MKDKSKSRKRDNSLSELSNTSLEPSLSKITFRRIGNNNSSEIDTLEMLKEEDEPNCIADSSFGSSENLLGKKKKKKRKKQHYPEDILDTVSNELNVTEDKFLDINGGEEEGDSPELLNRSIAESSISSKENLQGKKKKKKKKNQHYSEDILDTVSNELNVTEDKFLDINGGEEEGDSPELLNRYIAESSISSMENLQGKRKKKKKRSQHCSEGNSNIVSNELNVIEEKFVDVNCDEEEGDSPEILNRYIVESSISSMENLQGKKEKKKKKHQHYSEDSSNIVSNELYVIKDKVIDVNVGQGHLPEELNQSIADCSINSTKNLQGKKKRKKNQHYSEETFCIFQNKLTVKEGKGIGVSGGEEESDSPKELNRSIAESISGSNNFLSKKKKKKKNQHYSEDCTDNVLNKVNVLDDNIAKLISGKDGSKAVNLEKESEKYFSEIIKTKNKHKKNINIAVENNDLLQINKSENYVESQRDFENSIGKINKHGITLKDVHANCHDKKSEKILKDDKTQLSENVSGKRRKRKHLQFEENNDQNEIFEGSSYDSSLLSKKKKKIHNLLDLSNTLNSGSSQYNNSIVADNLQTPDIDVDSLARKLAKKLKHKQINGNVNQAQCGVLHFSKDGDEMKKGPNQHPKKQKEQSVNVAVMKLDVPEDVHVSSNMTERIKKKKKKVKNDVDNLSMELLKRALNNIKKPERPSAKSTKPKIKVEQNLSNTQQTKEEIAKSKKNRVLTSKQNKEGKKKKYKQKKINEIDKLTEMLISKALEKTANSKSNHLSPGNENTSESPNHTNLNNGQTPENKSDIVKSSKSHVSEPKSDKEKILQSLMNNELKTINPKSNSLKISRKKSPSISDNPILSTIVLENKRRKKKHKKHNPSGSTGEERPGVKVKKMALENL